MSRCAETGCTERGTVAVTVYGRRNRLDWLCPHHAEQVAPAPRSAP